MKIVCDACAAKYSIADEKVAGKVFKIRCKKCSNVIVVRGAADAEAGAPEQLEQKETRVFDYSGYDSPQDAVAAAESSIADGAVWHVVIDQEQVGPLSPEEVRAHFARGEIDAESFIWREGFTDWERVDSLPEFADLAASNNVDDAAAAMFGGPGLDDGAGADDPADLFTAQSADPIPAPAADAGLFGGAADDGGLFGGGGGGGGGGGMAEPAMAAADDKLKGQRNENSVLFSLNNLASLASDAPKAAAPVSSSSSSNVAQAGGQEGSGLIDIRAMASMYVGNNDGARAGGAASIDDLPVFSQPAITAASPVLMPVASPANNNKLLVALIAGIGALLLIAVLLVVLVLRGGGDDGEKQAVNQAAASGETGDTGESGDGDKASGADKTGEAGGEANTTAGAGKTAPPPGDDAAKKKAEEAAAKKAEKERVAAEREAARKERLANETPAERRRREKKEKKLREDRERKRQEARQRKEDAKRRAEERKITKPDTGGSSSGGCEELDCLVNPNKACCRKKKKSSGSSKSDSNLPDRPSKSSLSSGTNKARGSAKSCGAKADWSGTVKVKIKVSGSGRVSSASGSGGPSGVNRCVASAVKRKARYPKSKNGISFTYRFTL